MCVLCRYVCCYLCRKNFPFLIPELDNVGILTIANAAVVASCFETSIGVVKLFGGGFVDRHKDPARLLSHCLLISGASCLALQVPAPPLCFWSCCCVFVEVWVREKNTWGFWGVCV